MSGLAAPLSQHLDDTAAVAGRLWDVWVPRPVRRAVSATAAQADHQLLTLDLTLVTAEGQQGAIEAKVVALGAQVTVEDDF